MKSSGFCFAFMLGSALATSAADGTNWKRVFDAWKAPCDPFRIASNVYYVGASGVSSFLIATREGHVLIDTGFEETVGVIRTNMAWLGFRLEDLKLLLSSHPSMGPPGAPPLWKELTGV